MKFVLLLHQLFDLFQRLLLVKGQFFDLILYRVPVFSHVCDIEDEIILQAKSRDGLLL